MRALPILREPTVAAAPAAGLGGPAPPSGPPSPTPAEAAPPPRVIQLAARAGRECGSCTLCCTVMAVDELQKPAGCRCAHVLDYTGCTVYGSRPEACRVWSCLWRLGLLEDADRPDRSGVVMDVEPVPGRPIIVAREHIAGAARREGGGVRRFIEGLAAQGVDVFVVTTAGEQLRARARPVAAYPPAPPPAPCEPEPEPEPHAEEAPTP